MKNQKEITAFCEKHNITQAQFRGEEGINGSLDLPGLTSIPEGFNPTVGGYLDLRGLTAIPTGFNPTVGGGLDLCGLTAIPTGFNPTVGGYLYLPGLTSIPEGFNPTVGGSLDLPGLTSIPDGFNPTVGGSLWLAGLTSIPDGFTPTVGGYLNLPGLTSIPDGFNPTVGGYLNLRGLIVPAPTTRPPTALSWQGGKYVSIDGIFAEVISKKGNSYKLRKIGQDKPFCAIVDGALAAHGATLRDARADLEFKKLQKTMNVDELVAAIKQRGTVTADEYRLLTGACREGVMQFKAQHNIRGKSLPLAKVLKLTASEYGGSRMAELFN